MATGVGSRGSGGLQSVVVPVRRGVTVTDSRRRLPRGLRLSARPRWNDASGRRAIRPQSGATAGGKW